MQYEVIHPFAGVSFFGIDDAGKANGWAKVTDLEGSPNDTEKMKAVVETGQGSARLQLTDVKRCIPAPDK